MKYARARTKTIAVALAEADYKRRQRLTKLAKKLGNFRDLMTREELLETRAGR